MSTRLLSVTIAVNNMPAVAKFYGAVLGIEFSKVDATHFILYKGKWNNVTIVLCPAETAGISATQNRHQFDIEIPSLEEVQDLIKQYGGAVTADVVIRNGKKVLSATDPDGNSLVFIEEG